MHRASPKDVDLTRTAVTELLRLFPLLFCQFIAEIVPCVATEIHKIATEEDFGLSVQHVFVKRALSTLLSTEQTVNV